MTKKLYLDTSGQKFPVLIIATPIKVMFFLSSHFAMTVVVV